jgi:hypothetical protein
LNSFSMRPEYKPVPKPVPVRSHTIAPRFS